MIKRNKKGQFIKGNYLGFGFKKKHKPWNKNKKGIHLSPETEFKKGQKPWNLGIKGVHFSSKTEIKKGQRISQATEFKKGENTGSKNQQWKGDGVGYHALHGWVRRKLGKPKICEYCDSSRNIQWANKSHKYLRELNDWMSLCKKCHVKYDRINNWGIATRMFNL